MAMIDQMLTGSVGMACAKPLCEGAMALGRIALNLSIVPHVHSCDKTSLGLNIAVTVDFLTM